MARRPHLALRRLEGELDRRKRPGFSAAPPRDHRLHGIALAAEATSVLQANAQRPEFDEDPSLVLRVHTSGYLDESALAAMEMTVLSQSGTEAFVVHSPDPGLTRFRERVAAFAGPIPAGQKGAVYASTFNAIDRVEDISPEDRISPTLVASGFGSLHAFEEAEPRLYDIELWDPNDGLEAVHRHRVEQVLDENGGALLSEYRGKGLFLLRVRADGRCVQALLRRREVALLDLPPTVEIGPSNVSVLTLEDLPEIVPPPDDAPCIGIVDSGITAAHPLLAPAVAGAFGVPSGLGDSDERGHGTAVAGIALYGSLLEQLDQGQMTCHFHLASAKVVDANAHFDEALTVPDIIERAIRRLHDEFGATVINISLADRNSPVGGRPSAWAMVLDNLVRELDVVITVSAGNAQTIDARLGAEGLDIYPDYLIEASNRLYEPGSSLNALVVGSMAHGNGLMAGDEARVELLPLTERGDPSPFGRAGPGFNGAIKPDFLEYGGTAIWDGLNQVLSANRDGCGILTLHENYTENLFAYRHGTSFAAPGVAHKAALLRNALPDASANLVRALLAVAASYPDRPLYSREGRSHLVYAGYGLVGLENALESDDVRPILFVEDSLAVDTFAVYELPIPHDFQVTPGIRHIRVSLAFDPPVRNTRRDYAGIRMGFHLVRGKDEEEVFDAFRKWEQEDREERGDPFRLDGHSWQCKMEPIATIRENGSLQVGEFVAQRSIDQYGDTYYLVVRCEGGWAGPLIDRQDFAVAVELWHEAQLNLYQSLSVLVPA